MGCGGSGEDDGKPKVVTDDGKAKAGKAKHEKKKQKQHLYYVDDESDRHHHTKYAVHDAETMPKTVMISCKAGFKEGAGSVCMFGGNNTDSYQAGYLIYKTEDNKLTFGIQMKANGSDEWIESEADEKFAKDDECHIVAIYDGTTAYLYVDGALVASEAKKFVPAEGGIVSFLSGSHKEDDPKDQGGEDHGGVAWIKHLYITDAPTTRSFYSQKIFEHNHHIDKPVWNVGDAGLMPPGVFIRTTVFLDEDIPTESGGTMLMFGGNTTDSYLAGYILFWSQDKFLWGIQMNANDSGPALETEQIFPKDKEYVVTATYKNGHAALYIEDEDGKVSEYKSDVEWKPAEGGVLSILTGCHLDSAEQAHKDTAPEGTMEIDDTLIATI
jgi:hypothetical protein